MNIFGDNRSVGPAGPPGQDAVKLSEWCPNGILRLFRESEQCCYFFNTEKDGITSQGQHVALKDRFGANDAICVKNFQKPIKIKGYYGIPLRNTLYQISNIDTAETPISISVIAFAFKRLSKLTNEDKYIVTNESKTRGVTISSQSLNFLGTDALKLAYSKTSWNFLVVQYSNIAAGAGDCFFILNGKKGFFKPHKTIIKDPGIVFIGGDSKGDNTADVLLTNFEIYTKIYDTPPVDYHLPADYINLINDDMARRVSSKFATHYHGTERKQEI